MNTDSYDYLFHVFRTSGAVPVKACLSPSITIWSLEKDDGQLKEILKFVEHWATYHIPGPRMLSCLTF